MTPLMAGGAVLICIAVFTRTEPFRALRTLATYGIAAEYLVGEMLRGAWERRDRWQHCLWRARGER